MKNALIIFVKNLEKGKVKTRLAKTVGEDKALELYQQFMQYTRDVVIDVEADTYVYYSNYIEQIDVWSPLLFQKKIQKGKDLGERMKQAFLEIFNKGADKVCIIGSDCLELEKSHLIEAYQKLEKSDLVIGPAMDGGYYLLGMKKLHASLFENLEWSTKSVFDETIKRAKQQGLSYQLLLELSDIDTEEDLNRSIYQK